MDSAWSNGQGVRLDSAFVRRSELASDNPWIVIDSLSRFADEARRLGGFSMDDLPREILQNSQVTQAAGQIDHNGVSGFIHNVIVINRSEPDRVRRLIKAADDGFQAVAQTGHAAVFREVCDLYQAYRSDFIAVAESSDTYLFKNKHTEEVEDRWFDLGSDKLLEERVRWVRSLPLVQAVGDSEYDSVTEAAWRSNPLRTARLEELARTEARGLEELQAVHDRQTRAWVEIQRRARRQGLRGRFRLMFRNI